MERLRRTVVSQSGAFESVEFEIFSDVPVMLRMIGWNGLAREFAEGDLFSSLIEARRSLECDGYLLCCQGARPNVFPSGMLKQMNNGRFAYVLTRSHKLTDEDIVDAFAEADVSEVGTVDQQKDFVFAFFGIRANGPRSGVEPLDS